MAGCVFGFLARGNSVGVSFRKGVRWTKLQTNIIVASSPYNHATGMELSYIRCF
jgi:hypothetical protein